MTVIALSGCGLILQGRTTTISIDSVPPGASMTVAGRTLVTPGEVAVEKSRRGVVVRSTDGRYRPACRIAPFDSNEFLITLDSIPLALGLLVDWLAGSWPGEYVGVILPLTPIDSDRTFRPLPSDAAILEARWLRREDVCATAGDPLQFYVARYDLALLSVERPGRPSDRYGPVVRSGEIERNEQRLQQFSYEDSLVRLTVLVATNAIEFELENRTEHSQKLIWDEAAFVDFDRTSHRVIHRGVRYIDRNSSQPPSVIPGGQLLQDVIVPVNRIRETRGGFGYDAILPAMYRECSEEEEAFVARVEALRGARVAVLLPIEVAGTVNEYTLTFGAKEPQFHQARQCQRPDIRPAGTVVERPSW